MCSPAAEEYVSSRRDLLSAYRDLADAVVAESRSDGLNPDGLGELILEYVEAMIGIRACGRTVSASIAHAIASSCLQLCGIETDALGAARSVALERLGAFPAG